MTKNRDALELENPQKQRLLKAAHEKTLALGHVEHSDSYYDAIEQELGFRKPSRQVVEEDDDDNDVMSSASRPTARRSVSPPAAPVSRGGSRKGTVTLSAAEKEAAEISGVSYDEYYRNKVRDQKRARG